MVMQADEVIIIMKEFYPDGYEEYLVLTGQRSRRLVAGKKPTLQLGQRREAMKQAAAFNAALMAERKEERHMYYDPLTQVVQYPAFSLLRPQVGPRPPNRYPVPVLPGQYQHGFRRWTAEELKAYMNPPPPPPAPTRAMDTVMQKLLPGEAKDAEAEKVAMRTQVSERIKERLKGNPIVMQAVPQGCLCGICLKGAEANRAGVPEELITCSQCDAFGHPTCLEMSSELVAVIKTYKWQCMECKVCTLCEDPDDEANLLFCDECDRGYHTYCVGLSAPPRGMPPLFCTTPPRGRPYTCDLPVYACPHARTHAHTHPAPSRVARPLIFAEFNYFSPMRHCLRRQCVGIYALPGAAGRWICDTCGLCASCGTTQPGPDGAHWQHMVRSASSSPPLPCIAPSVHPHTGVAL